MTGRVIDRAIQAYGAEGVSQDTPLARMAAGVRTLRIADVRWITLRMRALC
jgi:acyl-CoA dehydrogenase